MRRRRSSTAPVPSTSPAAESAGSLARLLDSAALRRLAGPAAFARGEAYFASGQVLALSVRDARLTATVRGGQDYRVRLWARDEALAYTCTCPVGEDGLFCKHVVAAALAWLEQASAEGGTPARTPSAERTAEDVRTYLAGLEKSALVDLLMERASEDEGLRRRLALRAATAGPGGGDPATLRNAIAAALDPGDFLSQEETWEYGQRAEEAVESIEALLRDGRAAEALDLTEHALATLEGSVQSVGDSDGAIYLVVERLGRIHRAACEAARPDPEALARRLFRAEVTSGFDIFVDAAEQYADALGERGLAVFRRLAEAEWAKLPPVRPGVPDPEAFGRHYRITRIMEALARRTGDLEALVAIKSRDLSEPGAYLEVAETYRAAGRADAALDWAERGLRAFPKRPDGRLLAFLVAEYHRRKRHDDALALAWTGFEASPQLETYRKLRASARRARRWRAYRQKALGVIREAVEAARRRRKTARWAWEVQPGLDDHSRLVEVLLWEWQVDAAWREAKAGGCAAHLWLELAAAREAEHPADALEVYQGRIEPTLGRANADAYREAVQLLRKIRGLMGRLGREETFDGYLAEVRARHRRRRNFLRLLDHARWG